MMVFSFFPQEIPEGILFAVRRYTVQNDGDVWKLSETLPVGGCLRNTLLWPSTLFSDGKGSRASSFNRLYMYL